MNSQIIEEFIDLVFHEEWREYLILKNKEHILKNYDSNDEKKLKLEKEYIDEKESLKNIFINKNDLLSSICNLATDLVVDSYKRGEDPKKVTDDLLEQIKKNAESEIKQFMRDHAEKQLVKEGTPLNKEEIKEIKERYKKIKKKTKEIDEEQKIQSLNESIKKQMETKKTKNKTKK